MDYIKKSCVKIDKKQGETIRQLLLQNNLLDHSVRIDSDEEYIYLPLIDYNVTNNIFDELIIIDYNFKINKKTVTMEEILGFSPSYEIIGNLAILEDDTNIKKSAQALMSVHPHVKTVLFTDSPVEGEFRTRKFEIIKGNNTTCTRYKEYGCSYLIDMEKAYFTPRLASERVRVLNQIKNGQTVIDMFAGVGPFSILIGKNNPSCKIISIDKNPEAIKLLQKNIIINKLTNVNVIEGDAKDVMLSFAHISDHIIMNLPHNAHEFLDAAMISAKNGTIIHFYDIAHEDNLYNISLEHIKYACEKANLKIADVQTRIVRSYAPHQFNVCIEVEISDKYK